MAVLRKVYNKKIWHYIDNTFKITMTMTMMANLTKMKKRSDNETTDKKGQKASALASTR